ncbi:MAG: glycosyltransferase family 4 protein [Acidimicrobiales bacterium]
MTKLDFDSVNHQSFEVLTTTFRKNDCLTVFIPRNASLSSGTRWLVDIAVELHELAPTLNWRMLIAGKDVSIAGQGFEASINRRLDSPIFQELRDKIGFLGYLDRASMTMAYQLSDVVLVPTFAYEGISLAVIEAMSLGKPIVATNVGGLNDSIVDGVSGLLTRPCPKEIAKTMLKLLTDPQLRRELSLGATALSTRFTREGFNSTLETVFHSMINAD